MNARISLFALVASLLLGCGETHTGIVKQFSYRPGYYASTIILIDGRIYPQQQWHPARCLVTLTDGWSCSFSGECDGIEFGRQVTLTCSAP